MLDDAERTVLEATEADLARGDPRLARRMRQGGRRGRGRGAHVVVTVVTVVLVVGLFWLGLPAQALLLVLLGLGLLLGLGWRPAGWGPAVLRRVDDGPA